MAVEITKKHSNTCLHYVATSKGSILNSLKIWQIIAEEAKTNPTINILLENYTTLSESSNSQTRAYQFALEFINLGIPQDKKIAIVTTPEKYDLNLFIQTVINNRMSYHVKMFTDLKEAQDWLELDL